MAGQLVIVTGTTGSGKSTTCTEFAARADDLWLTFGVDLFLSRFVPKKFIDGGPRSHEGVHMVAEDPRNPDGPAHLELGALGMTMIRTMHEIAAATVRAGQNVVMDHITTQNPPLLQEAVTAFRDAPVLFVALKPPPELLAERIDARLAGIVASLGPEHGKRANDNTKRVSRYMAREIFSHDCFDLVIDTGKLAPGDVCDAIRARLKAGPGEAFATLAKRFEQH